MGNNNPTINFSHRLIFVATAAVLSLTFFYFVKNVYAGCTIAQCSGATFVSQGICGEFNVTCQDVCGGDSCCSGGTWQTGDQASNEYEDGVCPDTSSCNYQICTGPARIVASGSCACGSGQGGTVCGNDTCESGENATSCPQDCGAAGGGSGTGSCTLTTSNPTGNATLNVPFDVSIGATSGQDICEYWDYTGSGTFTPNGCSDGGTWSSPRTGFKSYTSVGTYNARYRVEYGGLWAICSRLITVTAPIIKLTPQSFLFSAISGSSTPPTQTMVIRNTGTSNLNWKWRRVNASGATSPVGTWCRLRNAADTADITIDTGGLLGPGSQLTYRVAVSAPSNAGSFNDCNIQIYDPAATNNPQNASIDYVVRPSSVASVTATLAACPSQNVTLTWPAASSGSVSKTYNIYRNTSNSIPGSIYATTAAGATSWVDSSVKTVGARYYYWVETVSGGLVSPNKVAANTNSTGLLIRSCTPYININGPFNFTAVKGAANPPTQNLSISNGNTANSSMAWTASDNQAWLTLGTTSNTIAQGGGAQASVLTVNNSGLDVGVYTATITVSAATATNTPRTTTVTHTVTAGSCPAGSVGLSPNPITPGGTSAASAPAGFTGGSFASSNTSVATVSGSTVTGVSAGTSNISGSGWSYTPNGATGCSLTATTLTVNAAVVNAPPNAVANLSKDGVTYTNLITVTQGVPTPIYLSGYYSTDPNGWNDPVNGMSSGGRCDWNADLNQGAPTWEITLPNPADDATKCYYFVGNLTFNDPPGTITYNVLRLFDKPLAESNTATVQVTVEAPALTLGVSLVADPSSGTTPLSTRLTATVSGTAPTQTGLIDYYVWYDCDYAPEDILGANGACGPIPAPAPGGCADSAIGLRCDDIGGLSVYTDGPFSFPPMYPSAGTKHPKVIAVSGGLTRTDNKIVNVSDPTAADLVTSDKDIIGVNSDVWASLDGCNGTFNQKTPAITNFKLGDIIKYQICLSNTGSGNATNVIITDQLTNLASTSAVQLDGVNMTKAANCANPPPVGQYSLCGSEPNQTIKFNLGTISPSPPWVKITFQAKISVPTGFSAPSSRFQNVAVICYERFPGDTGTCGGAGGQKTALTPLLLFNITPTPIKREE